MRISEKMETEPLQNFNDICLNCEIMKKALSATEDISKGEARSTCSSCRKIYKFDALYRVLQKPLPFGGKRNKGKKSLITEHEKQVAFSLRNDGFSYREIADKMGYSKNTIARILKDGV